MADEESPLLRGLGIGPAMSEESSEEDVDTDAAGLDLVSEDVADAIVSGDRDRIKAAVKDALMALRD